MINAISAADIAFIMSIIKFITSKYLTCKGENTIKVLGENSTQTRLITEF